jgi:hypothetical protein
LNGMGKGLSEPAPVASGADGMGPCLRRDDVWCWGAGRVRVAVT